MKNAILFTLIASFSITHAQTITIGNQVWMTKNLDVSTFRNGDVIPEAKTMEDWKKAGENKQPVWCYYDNDPKNGVKYGKLYNWYAVVDPRGLAPIGWHIPSDDEWTALVDYLYRATNFTFPGTIMKSTSGWKFESNGTLIKGFSGQPGGYCNELGETYSVGYKGVWWSLKEKDEGNAWSRGLDCYHNNVDKEHYNKKMGLSIRCIKDKK
jgi:uncharacterized protein (TIGR02145 family)